MGLFSKQVMGLDIGRAAVKVVGLELGKEPIFIGCKEIPVDPKIIQKEGFTDIPAIAAAIKEAMSLAAQKPLKPHKCYTSVDESLVFRKIIDVPKIEDPVEFREAIRMEVSQYLPNGLEAVELDYQVLGSSTENKLLQVLVVTVDKPIVQQFVEVFRKLRIPLRAVDTKPASVARAIINPKEKETLALVEIGSDFSTISIYDQKVIQVSGSINLGANHLKNSETGQLEEGSAAEEKLKRLLNSVNDELEHVLKFYENRVRMPKKIKEVRLSGGGSMAHGVREGLAKISDLKIIDGAAVIKIPPFCDRRFLGALGSALYPTYETD